MEKFRDSLLKSKKSSKIQIGKDKKKDAPDMAVCCPCKLSLKQRLIGFIICYAVALVIDIASFLALFKMLTGHPEKFAIAYSIGNIVAFVGTGFLVGFCVQLKSMFAKTRILATIVFLAAMIMCFISALVIKNPVWVLVFLVIQFLAFFWYSISYIPLARTAVKKCLKSCFKCKD